MSVTQTLTQGPGPWQQAVRWAAGRPWLWGSAWTGLLVGSLYLWPPSRNPALRHTVPVIQRRMVSMLTVCAAQALLNPASLRQQGLLLPSPSQYVTTTVGGLLSIMLLFAGPLLQRYLQPELFEEDQQGDPQEQRWRQARDWAVAPLCEEYLFRAALIPLCQQAGWGEGAVRGLSPLMFSAAHVHHLRSVPALLVALQCGYTALFGAISAYLFTAAGQSYYAAAVAHMFCNWMGLPPLMQVLYPPPDQSPLAVWAVRATYVGGLIAFFKVSPLLLRALKAH